VVATPVTWHILYFFWLRGGHASRLHGLVDAVVFVVGLFVTALVGRLVLGFCPGPWAWATLANNASDNTTPPADIFIVLSPFVYPANSTSSRS